MEKPRDSELDLQYKACPRKNKNFNHQKIKVFMSRSGVCPNIIRVEAIPQGQVWLLLRQGEVPQVH